MKKTLLLLTLLPVAAAAQGIQFNVPGMTEQQKQAMQQMMGPVMQASAQFQSCLSERLGDGALNRVTTQAETMNKEITAQCKLGNSAAARRIAEDYAGTPEGQVALQCGQQIKPYLSQPGVQQLLGSYAGMAGELVNGQVPQDVCSGLKKS